MTAVACRCPAPCSHAAVRDDDARVHRTRGRPRSERGGRTRPAGRGGSGSGSSARPATSAASWSGSWRATRTSSSSGSSGREPRPRPDRRASTRTSRRPASTVDADAARRVDAVFLALPHGTAAELVPDLVAAGTAVIDLGPRLPPPRPGRLPALVRLRAPAPGPPRRARSTACRSSTAPSSQALVDAAGRDRRLARLLPDRDAPRARAAGAGRADRRPRRRCQERRLGRRPRGQARPDVRRGQREREGVRHRRPPPRRRDRAGARRHRGSRRARRVRQPRDRRGRLPAPPHPDDARHPVGLPRPPDPAGRPGRARRPVRRGLRATSRS